MDTFIKELLGILNPTNFPMFVAIFLLIRVDKTLKTLSEAVSDSTKSNTFLSERISDLTVQVKDNILSAVTNAAQATADAASIVRAIREENVKNRKE